MSPNMCFWDVPEWYYREWLLLGMLDASNLLQYAIHNFYSYHCLFGLASRGLQRPRWAQISVFGMSQRDIIVIDHYWACWTLPNCSNMPYTTFIPTIVCLVWPLEASRGPQRPKMSPNECFRTFPECYHRDLSLVGPFQPSYNIGGDVPPTLDQVWPLNSS